MGKSKKLSVRGDRRKVKTAKTGTKIPSFVAALETKHRATVRGRNGCSQNMSQQNYQEIVRLIGYLNTELFPLVQRTQQDLRNARVEIDEMNQKIQLLELKETKQPSFALYPSDDDSLDQSE